MSSLRITLAAVLLITSTEPSAMWSQTPPPPLQPGAVVDTLHGTAIADPFRQLETGSSDNVKAWIASQDRYARAFIAASKRHQALRAGVRAIAEARVYSAPIIRGGIEFYSTFSASGPGSAVELYLAPRRRQQAARRVPGVDAYQARTGSRPLIYQPSPDGKLVAVGFASQGTSWVTVRVFRVADGVVLPDSIAPFYRALGAISWSDASDGLYYDHFVPDASAAQGVSNGEVRFRRLAAAGKPASDDLIFTAPAGRNRVVGHSRSPRGRYLSMLVTNTDTRETTLWLRDLGRPGWLATPVALPAAGPYAYAGELDGRLYYSSWANAAKGKVVAYHPAAAQWVDVVPESSDPISTWSGVGANVLGRRILVGYVRDSRLEPVSFRLDGTDRRPLPLPRLGSVWTGFVGDPISSEVYYQLQGMADPGTIYRLDLTTGVHAPYRKPSLGYDPEQFLTERLLYPAKDGSRVPLHVVRRADRPLDGTAPLILYGYGFGGWIASPWFQPAMAQFVQNGGIWALAGVRGGGEFGVAWQDAGSRRQKQVGIDDYNAAAEWLIANRYTTPDRMVANASSAGGPLVGAAILQRPELYRAAIFDYSVFDMLRYDRYSHARHWQADYGSPADSADFEALRRYSPYHTVAPGRCYPAVLTAPGELDQTAPLFHSAKFVAALQSAGSSCHRPALLRVTWRAGHSAGATVADATETWADELAFLDLVLAR